MSHFEIMDTVYIARCPNHPKGGKSEAFSNESDLWHWARNHADGSHPVEVVIRKQWEWR